MNRDSFRREKGRFETRKETRPRRGESRTRNRCPSRTSRARVNWNRSVRSGRNTSLMGWKVYGGGKGEKFGKEESWKNICVDRLAVGRMKVVAFKTAFKNFLDAG